MEHETIRVFIVKNGGYQTLTQLKARFKGENEEILEMNLTFLVEKNRIRKASFQSPEGHDTLYYLPRE